MSKNKKIEKSTIIWSCGIILCLIIFATAFFIGSKETSRDKTPTTTKDETVIYNDNKDVIGDKEIENVSFTNIECSFDGFNSLLTYTITNNGKNSIILGDYELIVKDKDSKILAIMVPGDTSELKPKESFDIGNAIDIDLTKAFKLELNKVK